MKRKFPTKVEQKTVAPVKKPPAPLIWLESNKPVYAFIDASNLFWGGRESLGFKVDYQKLLEILRRDHHVQKAFYYGGVRIFDFEYSIFIILSPSTIFAPIKIIYYRQFIIRR